MTYHAQKNYQPNSINYPGQSDIIYPMLSSGVGNDTKAIPGGFQGLEPSMDAYKQSVEVHLNTQENADLYQSAFQRHEQSTTKEGKLASFHKRINGYHRKIKGHKVTAATETSVTDCPGVTIINSEGVAPSISRKPYIYNERTGTYRNGDYEFRNNNSDFFDDDIREVVRMNQIEEGSANPYPRTNGISDTFLRYLEAERLKNMADDSEVSRNASMESVVINQAYWKAAGNEGLDPYSYFMSGGNASSNRRNGLGGYARSNSTEATSIGYTYSYRSSSSCYDSSTAEVMEPHSSLESETHSDHSVSSWIRNKLHHHHQRKSKKSKEELPVEGSIKPVAGSKSEENDFQDTKSSRFRSLWHRHNKSGPKRRQSIRYWWTQHFTHWKDV